jgi:predicted Fe-Mo cluster-binding NifX family protein
LIIDDLVKSRHPVEKRGPGVCNFLRTLDSGFRRNDGKNAFSTFYETVIIKQFPEYTPEHNKEKSMRVAVTCQGTDIGAEIDSRFGRAPRFLIVDTETMDVEVIENAQTLDLPQGAGIQAAHVKVVVGVKGKIMAAVKALLAGEYQPVEEAHVEGHWM